MTEEKWPRRVSAKLFEASPTYSGPKTYLHWCPGCRSAHVINTVEKNHCNAIWRLENDDLNQPEFSPSVNIVGRCHYYIRRGRSQFNENPDISYIDFLSDSKHALAGQRVPLPDMPEEW